MRLPGLKLMLFATMAAVFASCTPTQTEQTTLAVTCTAQGPFFAGANSLIAEHSVDLKQLIEGKELTEKQIKHIHLKHVEVTIADDSLDLSAFSSASLQFVADDVEMTSVAVKNPIDADGKSVVLESSMEADVRDYFKQDAFTLVLDLDLLEDLWSDDLSADVRVELEVSYTE